MTGLLDIIWGALTGHPYYSGQQASRERGLPPSVTSGVAYAQVPDAVRHELWLRAKATDAAGRAAMAAELARANLIGQRALLPAQGRLPEPRDVTAIGPRPPGGHALQR